MFGAAAISRETSSRLKTTGSLRGVRTGRILAISSDSNVTSKKNFRPVSVAFTETADVPASTMCSWNNRRSSAEAVSGDRRRNAVRLRTARI